MGIFGGQPKQNPNQTVTNNPPDYAVPYLKNIADLSKSAYDQFIANGYNQPFQGQRTAGKTPWDTMSMDIGANAAGSFMNSGAAGNTMDLSKYYNDKILSGGYNPTNAINAYANPIIENFTNKIAPRLTSSAIDAGAYGGSKAQQFYNQAAKDTSQTLADTASRVALDWDTAEKNAAGLVPTLANQSLQQSLTPADIYGNIGATERGFQQGDINDEIARWNELTESPFAGLGQYAGLVQGAAGNYGSKTTYGYSQPTSNFSNALGLGLGGLNALGFSPFFGGSGLAGLGQGLGSLFSASTMGPFMLSDKRLKENIKFERMFKGHKLYSFNYIWDKAQRYVGVLAQDLLEVLPSAVSKIGEYYCVDYTPLGFKMEKVCR